jgi:hypothetical protein
VLAVRGNMLARRFARFTDQVKVTLFEACCQNLYTGGLWMNCTKRSLNALRIQYNNIFRIMLGIPRFCSASGMFAQAGINGFQALVRKKVASLISRLGGILRVAADDPHAPVVRHFLRTMTKTVIGTFSGTSSQRVPLKYTQHHIKLYTYSELCTALIFNVISANIEPK